MPHLSFAISRHIPDATKVTLAQRVRQLFAEVMDTGTDHISISIHECGTHDLSLGRVQQPEKGIALVDADIRKGRTPDQRRTLALGFIGLLQELLHISPRSTSPSRLPNIRERISTCRTGFSPSGRKTKIRWRNS